MSVADLSMFCGMFSYIYVEDAVVNGVDGCWFVDFYNKRRWLADTMITYRLNEKLKYRSER